MFRYLNYVFKTNEIGQLRYLYNTANIKISSKCSQSNLYRSYSSNTCKTKSTVRHYDGRKVDQLIEFGKYCLECLPKYIQHVQIATGDELELLIAPEGILPVMYFLRNHQNAQFRSYSFVTAIDVPTRRFRFEVIYSLLSLVYNSRVRIKTYTDELTPIDSCCQIFYGANWLEREVYDMFGIIFRDHPDLRRVLTDYAFEGHPLRKDFPMTGYLEVRYDDERKRVVYEPLELAQEYRLFNLSTPWELFPNYNSNQPKTKRIEKDAKKK